MSLESARNSGNSNGNGKPKVFVPREALMSRANSLKKALKQIIEHAEQGMYNASGRECNFQFFFSCGGLRGPPLKTLSSFLTIMCSFLNPRPDIKQGCNRSGNGQGKKIL